MTVLETERLRLRMFTPDDLDDLTLIFANKNVMRYLGVAGGESMSREETETALLSIIRHWERHGFGRWAVVSKDNESLIGCSGLRSYEGTAELVYLIDEKYWRKGMATEIARACLEFGFGKHDFDTIIAFARHGNAASIKVMQKVGMTYVRDTTVFGVSVVQYEISRRAYQLNRAATAGGASQES